MKTLFCAVLFTLALGSASAQAPTAGPRHSLIASAQGVSTAWQEHGSVTLYSKDGTTMGTAKLYLQKSKDKLRYKVKLSNGEEYAVAPNPNYAPKAKEFSRQCRYMAHVYFYIKKI